MTPITIAAVLGSLLGLVAGALLWRGRGSWDRADLPGLAAATRCRPSHNDIGSTVCDDESCQNYGKESKA